MADGVLRCNQSTRDRKQRERFSPTERMEWQRRRYSREAAYDATATVEGMDAEKGQLSSSSSSSSPSSSSPSSTITPATAAASPVPGMFGCRAGRCGAACVHVHTADVVTSISPPSTPFNLLSFAQLPFGPPRQDLEPGPW